MYVLGVDVGGEHTTAALCGHDERRATVLPLDAETPSVHSVLYLSGADTVLVGRDALARAGAEPDRVARWFGTRVGDPVPPLLGGQLCPAEMLVAALVGWVFDRAVEATGAEPERVVLTHPAGWGPHRRGSLDAALCQAGMPDVLLLPQPVAAAECHAARNPMAAGDTVAVCDLGARTLGCAVARLGPAGFGLLRWAETDEAVGGSHFDDALTGHVLDVLGHVATDFDPLDGELRAAMAALRSDCRAAKEALSTATEVFVPTPLLGPPSGVLVDRTRFDELIGPSVRRTVDLLSQTIHAAGLPDGRPGAVTLIGGSARVPLVVELIKAAAPARVATDPDPGTAVARGAALAGWRSSRAEAGHDDPVLPRQRDGADPDESTLPPRPPVEVAPLDVPRRGSRRWKAVGRARRRTG